MNRSLLQDYTLNEKPGKNIGDCTVGIIGAGQMVVQLYSGFMALAAIFLPHTEPPDGHPSLPSPMFCLTP